MSDPSEELIDRLDDEGRTIGVVTRKVMRMERLPHRCVYLLVFHSDGRLFVHQRTPTKETNPSFWDVCVGGLPSAGEPDDLAVGREAREEIGVDVVVKRLFPFRFPRECPNVFGTVYRTTHDGPFVYQPEEVTQGEFVTAEELTKRVACEPFCPDGLAVLTQYRQWINASEPRTK
jgi:isopentenyldiphosphate isomerase